MSNKENQQIQEIINITKNINHLLDNCTHNFNQSHLIELSKRFELVLAQCKFWEETGNNARQVYDLRNFGMWLCDKIAQAEDEFWGKENS
jgi:hypothetical protein